HLGDVYLRQNRIVEAQRLLMHATQASARVHGQDHPYTISAALKLASAYEKAECLQDAEGVLADIVDGAMRSRNDHLGEFLLPHGRLLRMLGRYSDAEVALLMATDAELSVSQHKGASSLQSIGTAFADLYKAWGKPEQAAMWSMSLEDGN